MKHDYLIVHVVLQLRTVVQVKEQVFYVTRVMSLVSTALHNMNPDCYCTSCTITNVLSQQPLYVTNHTR